MTETPEMSPEQVLEIKLEFLRQEHRDLDAAITALAEKGSDQLAVRRLKKKKLALKDQMSLIQDRLTPDIIA